MKAYIDQSDGEFSFHCLDQLDLEVMLSAMNEQAGKANMFENHIVPVQKERLTNLIKLVENGLESE